MKNKLNKYIYLFSLIALLALTNLMVAQQAIPLYKDTSFFKSQRVTLTPYVAQGSRMAIIVCPGGSYHWLDIEGEGHEVGRWFQQQGISAFVLRYRVPGWMAWFTGYRYLFRGVRHPDMYNDGQRAMQYLHQHASDYGIDTNLIGMIGFSAGGHLVMHQACYPGRYRPAFVAPIYPVVTMREACVHKRSRRGILGEYGKYSPDMRDSLSLERHIPADCPPVFIVNCKDDPIVHYHNSELLDSALTARHIPHRYIQYQTGGHGFGVSDIKGTHECRPWKWEFLQWLKSLR